MSVQEIEAAAQDVREAEAKLKALMAQAVANGVPIAAAARAAGVTWQTAQRWLKAQS